MRPKSIWPQSITRKLRPRSVFIWRIMSLPFYDSVLAEHFEESIKKNIEVECCIGLIIPSKWNPQTESRMKNGSSLLWKQIKQIKRPIASTEMSRWQKMCSVYKKLKSGLHLDKSLDNRRTCYTASCCHALKGFLKLSAYQLQIFLVNMNTWDH